MKINKIIAIILVTVMLTSIGSLGYAVTEKQVEEGLTTQSQYDIVPNENDKDLNQAEIETTAESAILVEASSGKVLFQKNANKKLPPASMTKLMTMLLTVEAIESGKHKLTEKITASEHAWEMGGSEIFLAAQEQMSFRDILISIAVESANDGSVAMAEHLAGSEKGFVRMMNKRAKELGMKNTNFVNPHGLTADNHYTSAYDMSLVMREAWKYPLFRKVTAIKEYDLRGGKNKLWNTNKLLWWYDGADGGKTGWTEKAKFCLTSTVERDGLRLIAVAMGSPEPRSHFRESMKLYNWGFAKYGAVPLYKDNVKIKSIPVNQGVADQVNAVTELKVSVLVPKGETEGITQKIILPKNIYAPIKKGQKIGEMIVKRKGEEAFRVNLVAAKDVAKGTVFRQIGKIFNRSLTFGI